MHHLVIDCVMLWPETTTVKANHLGRLIARCNAFVAGVAFKFDRNRWDAECQKDCNIRNLSVG
jgi:hypothetical protein